MHLNFLICNYLQLCVKYHIGFTNYDHTKKYTEITVPTVGLKDGHNPTPASQPKFSLSHIPFNNPSNLFKRPFNKLEYE